MRKLWQKLFGRQKLSKVETELRPPVSRRLKTYSADSGYVYQYKSLGSRAGQYLFEVSRDRRTFWPWSVELLDEVVRNWEKRAGRELSSSERFGVAKIILQFEMDSSGEGARRIESSPQTLAAATQYLGLI